MARKEKRYHYIYKTTNIITGKYYIGMHSTDNLEDGYLGSGKILWRSVKKYGKENHKVEILEFLPNRRSLKNREIELVNEDLLKEDLCMNLILGGGFGSVETQLMAAKMGGLKFSDIRKKNQEIDKKYREKMSTIIKNQYEVGLRKKNPFYDWLGKKHSEETKQKMCKSKNNGENNSQYGTCWITNGEENKKIKKDNLNYYIINGWVKGRK